jgi:hypothetical protein
VLWPGEPDVACTRDAPQPCREVAGRVLRVERTDPDGDGDMHIVLASRDSLTLPGISVVKFARARRPAAPPPIGAWMSVAGAVGKGAGGESELKIWRWRR